MDKLGTFGIVDYIAFLGTLVVSMLIGVYFVFVQKQKTNADLLVGGRNMAVFPIALSLLATYMSAILVLGYAAEIYSHGTLLCETIVTTSFFIPAGGLLFLPTLYKLKITSAYEYLELRFESTWVRMIATFTFITQIILYMGVVLFAPSLALNAMVGVPIWVSILAVGGCAGIYTSIGGLKAVVWTDVFQIFMMFAGMIAIIVCGTMNVGGVKSVYDIANEHGRIEFLNFKMDIFTRHTSWNLLMGSATMWISSYGCHQTTVQRYCSMPSLPKAFLTLFLTGPLVALTMTLAALSGLVIFANYATCDPLTLGHITRNDQIAPYFVKEHLSTTPGLMGLFTACLYSGALSTVSSGLNSLAAVTWEDFCMKLLYFKMLSFERQGFVTKCIGIIYGFGIIGMGFLAGNLGAVLTASLAVNGSVAGPLLGVFILGILIPISNKYGAITGMIFGHAITLFVSIGGLTLHRKPPSLPFRIDGCSNETLGEFALKNTSTIQSIHSSLQNSCDESDDDAWPQKLFTISYLLYPVIGMVVTVSVGTVVSILTGCMKHTDDVDQYLHPAIVWFKSKPKLSLANTTIPNSEDVHEQTIK